MKAEATLSVSPRHNAYCGNFFKILTAMATGEFLQGLGCLHDGHIVHGCARRSWVRGLSRQSVRVAFLELGCCPPVGSPRNRDETKQGTPCKRYWSLRSQMYMNIVVRSYCCFKATRIGKTIIILTIRHPSSQICELPV